MNPLSIADPAPLPDPPLWERFILEQPWPLAVLLIVVVFVGMGKLKGRARVALPMLAMLGALAVVFAGYWVKTGREQIKASTSRLVAGVLRAEMTTLDAELDEGAKLFSWKHQNGLNKSEIMGEVGSRFRLGGDYAVKEHAILEVRASQDGANIGRALVKVRVTSEAFGAPFFSWWLLDYRREGDRWRALSIEPQSMSMVDDPRAKR